MAVYEITAPDGKTYEIEGSGTKEQALAHFQSQWKPSVHIPSSEGPSEDPEVYSNEGYNRPEVSVPESRLARVGRLAKRTAQVPGNILAGVVKSGVDAAVQTADAHPATKLLRLLGKTQGVDPLKSGQDAAKEAYDNAGPEAFVGKLGGDAALTSGLPGGTLLKSVGGGIASGAALPPGEGETRLGNAVQGGGAALGLGTAAHVLGATKRGLNNAFRGADARAARVYEKGGVNLDNVTNELQTPRTLPMTVASASGDEAMAGFEKSLRREPLKDPGRYSKLDDATNEAAWNKLTGILDNSATQLPGRQIAKQESMRGIEDTLDKVKIKSTDSEAVQSILEGLRGGKTAGHFVEPGDQRALNKAILVATDPNATYGTLARLHTNLGDEAQYAFTTPGNAQLVKDRVKALIDSRNNNAWSNAEKQFKSTLQPLEESKAANEILSDFQEPIGGMAKGAKAPTTIPNVTEARLRGSINQRGVDKTDPLAPVDRLNPVDRQQLEQLVQDRLKSEFVSQSKAISADIPGGRASALPTSKAQAARSLVGNILDTRARGTREAMDKANMTQEGWEKMVKAAEKDKRISARDAAMLVGILRGTGPVAGALVTGDQ